MATIDVSPLVLKDVDITLDGDNYKKHVSGVEFTAKSSTIEWTGLAPDDSFTDATPPTWACKIDYVQDWDTTDSFSRYLLANAGEAIVATFKPRSAGTPSFAATITLVPGPIGGQGGKYATSSVTLGSTTPVPTYV